MLMDRSAFSCNACKYVNLLAMYTRALIDCIGK